MTLEHLLNELCFEVSDVCELRLHVVIVVEEVPVRGDACHKEHGQVDQQIECVAVDRAV